MRKQKLRETGGKSQSKKVVEQIWAAADPTAGLAGPTLLRGR